MPLQDEQVTILKRRLNLQQMERRVDPATHVGLYDLWRVLEEDIVFALSNEERQSTEVQVYVFEDERKGGEWLQRFSGDCGCTDETIVKKIS